MTHWVFHLFSTDGGKVVDHPVHQPEFGLAHIVHATTCALYGIDEVIQSACHRHCRSEFPTIRTALDSATGIKSRAIFAPAMRCTFPLLGSLAQEESVCLGGGGFRAAQTRCSLRFFGLRCPKIILASNSSWVPGEPSRSQLESMILRKSC